MLWQVVFRSFSELASYNFLSRPVQVEFWNLLVPIAFTVNADWHKADLINCMVHMNCHVSMQLCGSAAHHRQNQGLIFTASCLIII
jgi:hypothetical protein